MKRKNPYSQINVNEVSLDPLLKDRVGQKVVAGVDVGVRADDVPLVDDEGVGHGAAGVDRQHAWIVLSLSHRPTVGRGRRDVVVSPNRSRNRSLWRDHKATTFER